MSPRKAYQEELDKLSSRLEKMAGMTKKAIAMAVESFERHDMEMVEKVRELDERTYGNLVKAEKEIIRIIALHTPVAGDLRFIATSLKITTDFDRIVRYATDIADIAERISEKLHFKASVSCQHMAEMAVKLVDLAVDSFTKKDLSKTKEVFELEQKVDSLYDEIFREVLTYMMEDSQKITMGMNYQFVARYLERIADHACNIAERVVYMETGERVRM